MITARRSTSELARDLGIDCSESKLVQIDEPVLSSLADHIKKRTDFSEYERSKWDDPLFWNIEDTPARRSQYFTIGNSINFRFWKLEDGKIEAASGWRKGQRLGGSMYLWRSLRLCLEQNKYPILEAKFLASLSADDFDGIFVDDRGQNPLAIAKGDRIANLRNLGSNLDQNWQGQFYNLVRSTNDSLVAFVKLSSEFRAFDDPNFKLTMVNAILHSGSGLTRFDAEPLPAIDYHLLKQLLRHGVLRPRADLAQKLEQRQLMTSIEGQELRRVALSAFIRLSELTGVSGEILDNKWWWNRTKCRDKEPVCIDPTTAPQCPFYGPCEQRVSLESPVELTRYY